MPMNIARPSDGLLSEIQTLQVLRVLGEASEPMERARFVQNVHALRPSSVSRIVNTVQQLVAFGFITSIDDHLSITGVFDIEDIRARLCVSTATRVAEALTEANIRKCLQAKDDGSIWLDSKLLPASLNGLGLWVIEFGIGFRKDVHARYWQVHDDFKALFLKGVRDFNRKARRVQSAIELKQKLLEMEARGVAAEEWVLEYERRRLQDHPLHGQIRRVSVDDVGAGYDIASFSSHSALVHDLFIEVKSYVGQRRFFWSANEILTAEELGEEYCLYIIESSKLSDSQYEPEKIPGPFAALFQTEEPAWELKPSSYECVPV